MYDLNSIENMRGLHIAHINARSIVNKWDSFKAQFMSTNLHILGISETWLNNKLPSNMYILSNDFTLLRNDRSWTDNNINQPKKGGGVGMYIRSDLNFSDTMYSQYNNSNINIECQWVSITLPHNREIVVGNIYRPPQGNVDMFVQNLESILDNFDLGKIELYLIGDFNIDFIEKGNQATKKLIDSIKPYGLRQLIKEPTRYSKAKNSCLDLFITNSDVVERTGVCDINLSDHQLIMLTRKRTNIKKRKIEFTGLILKIVIQ